MKPELFERLAALPRLDPANAAKFHVPCKICGGPAAFFDVVDFNKNAGGYGFGPSGITVPWHRCAGCGFLFTPFFDDWSPQDFSRFVYNDDYVRVDPDYVGGRPIRLLKAIPPLLGPPSGLRILDYGSGAGIFVNGLVALGYQAAGYDPFSSPERPAGRFDLIICIEVIEHAPDPMAVLRDMRSLLDEGGGILLGETLQPPEIEELRASWWYCAPRNGHCSTFADRTLLRAAEQIGLRFHRGNGRHAFTSPEGGPVAEQLTGIVGPPLTGATLGAPGSALAPGWHSIERSPDGPFRWTARASVSWPVAIGAAGPLDIRIPIRNAAHRDFLRQCRILVEGRETETQIRDGDLVARVDLPGPAGRTVTVELRTPEPKSPRELRGVADDRPLGLAIAVV